MYPYFFFFNDTATTEIYTLSLHDALPILHERHDLALTLSFAADFVDVFEVRGHPRPQTSTKSAADRKSTRLNSSHSQISYAVFCLKKKKKRTTMDVNE